MTADSPTPPDLETTPPPTAPTTPPEYCLPDDPSLGALRGKSLQDLASYIATLEAAVGGNGHSAAAAPAPTPPPVAPAASPPSNGGYASVSDLQQLAQQQAAVTLNLAQQQYGDDFRRYPEELTALLQRVPREQLTLDVIGNAVMVVRGKHRDEYAAEKVRAVESTPFGTIRSAGRNGLGSYAPAPPKPEQVAEQAFATWQQRAAAAHIGEAEVREFCRENDLTPDEFFKQFGRGIVTDAVADLGSNGKKRG